MEIQNRRILESDVVILAEPPFLKELKTCTVKQLMERLEAHLGALLIFSDGAVCRVLIPNEPWRTGRIRLVVEFCPEEESQT